MPFRMIVIITYGLPIKVENIICILLVSCIATFCSKSSQKYTVQPNIDWHIHCLHYIVILHNRGFNIGIEQTSLEHLFQKPGLVLDYSALTHFWLVFQWETHSTQSPCLKVWEKHRFRDYNTEIDIRNGANEGIHIYHEIFVLLISNLSNSALAA